MGNVESRLNRLEAQSGLVELADGSKFRPHGGLALLRRAIRLEAELGREPRLEDFSEEDQELWRKFAKWTPEPSRDGELARMICDFARRLL